MEYAKVFWLGRHTTSPQLGAPVSKVHQAGLQVLRTLGWQQVPNDSSALPVFAFTTRKGANYPADKPNLPRVRQLPQQHTECLDDKRQLHRHLQAAGQAQLLPPSWLSLDDFTSWLDQATMQEEQEQQEQSPQLQESWLQQERQRQTAASASASAAAQVGSQPSLAAGASSSDIYETVPQMQQGGSCSGRRSLPGTVFVKHRSGFKGQAVYVAHTRDDLKQLQQKLKHSAADFVVQQEVSPPMLLDGRKFVLRQHVLIVLQDGCARPLTADADTGAAGDHTTTSKSAPLTVYSHEDVIVVQHACPYESGSSLPAVHISSKGAGHPAPRVLQQLPELHAVAWPQLQQLAARTVHAVAHTMVPPCVHSEAVLYHLFGFDCMVEASGHVVLLEVNSYPAVASGTMAAVSSDVYTKLVHDMVNLLVLPLTDGAQAAAGGFIAC